jgi:large subunit ribosomal protein L24
MKISQGDTVIVIAGKDKGKKGTVMRTLHAENRVIVAGINMVTKHIKKTTQSEGKKVRFEHSLHASNVMIVDPKTGKPSRIGYKKDAKGRKVRFAKKSGSPLERVRMEPGEAQKAAGAAKEATQAKAPKSAFWKKGPTAAAGAAETGAKTEPGAAQSNVTHRSAGRGS